MLLKGLEFLSWVSRKGELLLRIKDLEQILEEFYKKFYTLIVTKGICEYLYLLME